MAQVFPMTEKIPYIKNSFKGKFAAVKEWRLFDGEHGCVPVRIADTCMRTDKSPPPLASAKHIDAETSSGPIAVPPATTPAPPVPKPVKEDPLVSLLAWAITPADPRERKGVDKAVNCDGVQEPFDLFELPIGMHAEGLRVSEAFAKRWFAGRAYTAYAEDPHTGKMAEGRYDADMIDSDTVTLSWLFGFGRIKNRYDDLLSAATNTHAVKALANQLVKFMQRTPQFTGPLDTMQHCAGDLQDLHERFQFQFAHVGIAEGIGSSLGLNDVSASLGNFAFYATVARAHVKQDVYNRYGPLGTQHCSRAKVEVTHIYVYAKDSYSFFDVGSASQYLGHWNKTGVVIMPPAAIASLATKRLTDTLGKEGDLGVELGNQSYPPFPVDLVGKLLGRDVYYPVRNRDFREWRTKKGRGGDFLIFSDRKLIKLETPIAVELGEVCQ